MSRLVLEQDQVVLEQLRLVLMLMLLEWSPLLLALVHRQQVINLWHLVRIPMQKEILRLQLVATIWTR